jgi:catechol 2,3-dioxygenase-like lactoylglutathione lyase family enzyme
VFTELNHFGIVVRDLDASLGFYEDLFGARVVFRKKIPSSDTDVVYLQIAGSLIELLHPAAPAADEQFGITHIAFLTDSLDDDFARLTALGYEGLLAPRTAGTGVGRLAFVRGPDGARVEILERDVRMRQPLVDHPIVTSFDHYGLTTRDREAALEFYAGQLGLTPLPPAPGTPAADRDRLHYDVDVLEIAAGDAASDEPVFSHIGLRVSDAEAASRELEARGFHPERLTARAASADPAVAVRDPDGVRIVLSAA